jgi:hypothetical protein
MLDAPLDTWYVWLGVGAASLVVAGLALALPTSAPPSATPVADAVDEVAASPHEARTTVDVPGEQLRLQSDAVAVRSDGGTGHARFTYGPVTPVGDGRLREVLTGTEPEAVFESRSGFESAVTTAQNRPATWQESPDRLVVVRVEWGDVDATLVG